MDKNKAIIEQYWKSIRYRKTFVSILFLRFNITD